MPAENYSQDIWDYIEGMPQMPSRADRDALVEDAKADSSRQKRVRIWDYFFRIRPEDVGKGQLSEIAELTARRHDAVSKRDRELQAAKEQAERRASAVAAEHQRTRQGLERQISEFDARRQSRERLRNLGAVMSALGLIGVLSPALLPAIVGGTDRAEDIAGACCFLGSSSLVGLVLLVPGAILLLVGLTGMSSTSPQALETLKKRLDAEDSQYDRALVELQREQQQRTQSIEAEYQSTVARVDAELPKLEQQVADLRAQIPPAPTAEQVHEWMKEDIAWLTEQASERSGLMARLVELKDAPNPLCILGPAELQRQERIPEPYLKNADRRKHLKARRFAVLPDGRFEDFYGVYNLEFILVAEDMLGTYGTFFDFITGRVTGERTSEQYYHDVVAISTRREYREVEIGEVRVPIDDAPTFSMSLSSGETREVTFASQSYFDGIRKQIGEAEAGTIDVQRWVRNPEVAADNAIKALRARLRAHKGAPEDN